MKESQLFIRFFKTNLVLLGLLILAGGSIGALIQASRPTIYTANQLFEVRSSSAQLPEQTLVASLAVADHLVGLLRTKNVQQQINIPLGSDVNSVRFSMVGFRLSVSSPRLHESNQTLAQVSEYMLDRFNRDYPGSSYFLTSVGVVDTSSSKASVTLGAFIGSFLGFGLGLISALIKTYLRHL